MTLKEARRTCAVRRDEYQHARTVYDAALRLRLDTVSDLTALRSELEEALVAYYAAHSALHTALRPGPLRTADRLN